MLKNNCLCQSWILLKFGSQVRKHKAWWIQHVEDGKITTPNRHPNSPVSSNNNVKRPPDSSPHIKLEKYLGCFCLDCPSPQLTSSLTNPFCFTIPPWPSSVPASGQATKPTKGCTPVKASGNFAQRRKPKPLWKTTMDGAFHLMVVFVLIKQGAKSLPRTSVLNFIVWELWSRAGELRSDWGRCPWVAGPLQQIGTGCHLFRSTNMNENATYSADVCTKMKTDGLRVQFSTGSQLVVFFRVMS